MTRRLSMGVKIHGVDDETFGSNETEDTDQPRALFLDGSHPQASIVPVELPFGGEVRIEVHITGQLRANNEILAKCRALLFEGTSEDTNDLDGSKSFDVVVPAGERRSISKRVSNTDEGGDYADIDITFDNSPA